MKQMTEYNLLKWILQGAETGASLQLKDGSMPPGRNGPHGHTMTGARVTGHWAIYFTYVSQVLGYGKMLEYANRAYDSLASSYYRRPGGAFWHRSQVGRSGSNGLIGQAWTLESLLYGAKYLDRVDLLDIATDLVSVHQFNASSGLWNEVDVDGTVQGVGSTLNQQIWFTVMASKLPFGFGEVVEVFLDKLVLNIMQRCNGLLYTQIKSRGSRVKLIKAMTKCVLSKKPMDGRYNIDAGYQLFTLVGLAELYESYKMHPFFKSRKFHKSLRYVFSENYLRDIESSRFGFQYNVPGLEIPYVYKVFGEFVEGGMDPFVDSLFDRQLLRHINKKNGLMEKDTVDPVTLASRMYEIYRIDGYLRSRGFIK